MALFKFTRNILENQPIEVFNHGNHTRDFTYIDDIVEGVVRASDDIAQSDASWSSDHPSPDTSLAPFQIFNIGNNQPVTLRRFITAIEDACGKKAQENLLPMQAGDVPITYADIDELVEDIGFKPETSIEEGIKQFVDWYKQYYSV